MGLLLTGPCFGQSADYQLYHWGAKEDSKKRGLGGVFLGGGGRDVDEGMRRFVEHAGGGDIVVLRASGSDGYQEYLAGLGKPNSVVTLVFKSRRASFDKKVLKIIGGAEGIFLAGGRQDRYYDYWENSPVAALLQSCHERGVVLGGTSAGLAVLGQFCFAAKNGGARSKEVLQNPFHKRVSLAKGFIHTKNKLYQNILFDSHFSERERLGRLAVFLARLRQSKMCSNPVGIGIDEGTAVFIDERGFGRVYGRRRVQIVLLKKEALDCQLNKPLSMGPVSMARLSKGQQFFLPKWGLGGGQVGTLAVKKGILKENMAPRKSDLRLTGVKTGRVGQASRFKAEGGASRARLFVQSLNSIVERPSRGKGKSEWSYKFSKVGQFRVFAIVEEGGPFSVLSNIVTVTVKK